VWCVFATETKINIGAWPADILWLLLSSVCLYTIYCPGRLCKWTNKRRAWRQSRQLWRIDFAAAINFNLRALWPLAAAWVMNCGLFNELLSDRLLVSQHGGRRGLPPVCVRMLLHGQINFSPLFSINFTEVGIIVLLRHTNSTTELKLYIFHWRRVLWRIQLLGLFCVFYFFYACG